MYLIGKNTVNGIIATDQKDTYEADALLTCETSDKWTANGSSAVLEVGVSGGSAILIAVTNASTVSINKSDHLSVEWGDSTVWGSINNAEWASYSGSSITVHSGQDAYGFYHIWARYEEDTGDHVLTVSLSASGDEPVEAGAVYAGSALNIKDFRSGLDLGLASKSTVYPIGRRSEYVDFADGDVRRTWSGSVVMKISDWHSFRDAVRKRGQRPMAWMLSENFLADQWIALAKCTQLPRARLLGYEYVEASFSLEEA